MRSLARVTDGMKSRVDLKQVCCQGPAAKMEFPNACSGMQSGLQLPARAWAVSEGL